MEKISVVIIEGREAGAERVIRTLKRSRVHDLIK